MTIDRAHSFRVSTDSHWLYIALPGLAVAFTVGMTLWQWPVVIPAVWLLVIFVPFLTYRIAAALVVRLNLDVAGIEYRQVFARKKIAWRDAHARQGTWIRAGHFLLVRDRTGRTRDIVIDLDQFSEEDQSEFGLIVARNAAAYSNNRRVRRKRNSRKADFEV